MPETSRPEPAVPFVDLQITGKIFPKVMDSLRDPSLSDKESRYLAYLTGVCGTHGVTFRKRDTIASDLGKGTWTISRIEKSLISKGRITIFEYGSRVYRSPYPTLVEEFLTFQNPSDAPVEPAEQSCQPPPDRTVTEPSPPEPLKPTPEAVPLSYPHAPIQDPYSKGVGTSTCTGDDNSSNPVDNSPNPASQQSTAKKVSKEEIHKQSYQPPPAQPTEKTKDLFKQPKKDKKVNPHGKNRHLVRILVDDLADKLNAWGSWKYLARIVWNLREDLEEGLYEAVAWVLDEAHCNRCYSKIGLFDWYLKDRGFHPLK